MNVTFRFCFRSPLKSLKLPVFKGLSTDLGSHSFLHISFYPLYIIAGRTPKMWDLGRKLSVLEAKRLQGFPDDYKFTVSDNQAYKQLGNSVSVPVIQAIAKNMIEAYNKK